MNTKKTAARANRRSRATQKDTGQLSGINDDVIGFKLGPLSKVINGAAGNSLAQVLAITIVANLFGLPSSSRPSCPREAAEKASSMPFVRSCAPAVPSVRCCEA
jgi:hypothetical protein